MISTLVASLLISGPQSQQAPPVDLSKFTNYTSKSDEGDYKVGPPYTDAPELIPNPSVPKGTIYHLTMRSTDSKIYPGIVKTSPGQIVPYQRRLTVYVPSQYIAGTAAPFFVSQDSLGAGELPTILDT